MSPEGLAPKSHGKFPTRKAGIFVNYLLSVLVELGVVRIPAVAAVTCGALRLLVNFGNYGLDFAGELFACRLYPVVVARFKLGLCLCNGVFNGLFILFGEFVARLFNRLFKAVYHTFEVVLVVYRLFALLILLLKLSLP